MTPRFMHAITECIGATFRAFVLSRLGCLIIAVSGLAIAGSVAYTDMKRVSDIEYAFRRLERAGAHVEMHVIPPRWYSPGELIAGKRREVLIVDIDCNDLHYSSPSELLTEVGFFPTLKAIGVRHCDICAPDMFTHVPASVVFIDLGASTRDEKVLEELARRLPKLRVMVLNMDEVTEKEVTALGSMTCLRYVYAEPPSTVQMELNAMLPDVAVAPLDGSIPWQQLRQQ